MSKSIFFKKIYIAIAAVGLIFPSISNAQLEKFSPFISLENATDEHAWVSNYEIMLGGVPSYLPDAPLPSAGPHSRSTTTLQLDANYNYKVKFSVSNTRDFCFFEGWLSKGNFSALAMPGNGDTYCDALSTYSGLEFKISSAKGGNAGQ